MSYDTTVPSFTINQESAISLKIPQTDAYLTDQGYTYNQAGFTYDQVGVEYSGVTNANHDDVPNILAANLENTISLSIPQTQAALYDQGYIYNQTGFTYDQLTVAYGGISQQNEDVIPIILTARLIYPTASIVDVYTPAVLPNTNHSVGPGWFMFVTIP